MMSWSKNTRKSKHDSIQNDLTGELVPELEEKLLNNIEDAGLEDGLAGIKGGADMKGLGSAIRIVLTRTQLEVISRYKRLKKLIGDLESGLQELKGKIENLREHLRKQREKVKLASGILFTVSGLIYICADIEFSRETLISAWGLGKDSIIAQAVLIMGIAMAAILIKLAYSRFIECRYIEGSITQDKYVKLFFFITVPLFIFFFLQIAWVRSIIFKFSILRPAVDVYEVLYAEHPYMNTVAFIGIAFMFLIGGAVLLTVGMNELKRHSMYRADKKRLRELEKKYKNDEADLGQLYQRFHGIEALHDLYADEKSFNQLVETKTEFYASLFFWNYLRGERKRIDKKINQLPDENFHLFVRKVLDMKSRDGSLKGEGICYG